MDNIRSKSKEELILELEKARKAYDSLQVLYQQEINEKLKVESKVASDRVLSELMFQDHKSVMLLIDPLNGKIIDANKSAVQFYNYPLDQLRGMLISEINLLSHEQIEIEKEKALKEEQNLFIFPHRTSNGEIRQVEVHSSPVELNGEKLLFSIIHDITERDAINSGLKNSGDALRKAEEMGKFGNWYLFLDEKLIRASDGAILIYGLSENEILYDKVKEVALPEYRSMLNLALEDLIHKGKHYDVEYKVKRKSDGIIVDIHSVAKFDAAKNVVFGTIQDITERKRTEEALKESEEKFHSLFNNMIEGAALHKLLYNQQGDPDDYVIIETNPAFEFQLGISNEKVINKTSREAYGVDLPPFIDIYARVALSGKPEVFETYFPPLAKHFSISVYSPFKGSFATIFVDITERKKAEQSIRESEKRYHDLLVHLDAGIIVHASDTSVILVNPKASELLGLSEDQLKGKLAIDAQWKFISDDLSPLPVEEYPVNKIIISKKPIRDFLIGVQQPATSKVVWLLVNGLPSLDENGRIKDVLISFTDITDRKRIEDNLLESQRLLHEAQRLAQIGVWNWDDTTNIVTWSEDLCKIVGRDPALPVPAFKDQQFVFTPESYKLFAAAIDNVKITHRKIEIELEVVHADGNHRNVIGFVGTKYDSKGRIKGLYGTLQDITERKRTEESLKKSEDKFRNLVTNMQVGVLLQGPDAEITLSNPKALELLGLSEDQLMGKTSFDPDWNVIHEDGSPFPGEMHPVPRVIATHLPVHSVIMGVYRPTTHNRVWLLVDAVPELNEDGTVNQVICSFIDISKRKQAEELLQKSQFNLNNAQHMAHLGSWEWDMKANTIAFSDELFVIFGLSAECSVINADLLLEFIHPDDKAFYLNNLERSSSKGESVPFEYRIVRSDGEVRNLYASGSVIFDENHKPVKGMGVIQDITERKLAEEEVKTKNEELLRLVAEKDRFFSIIAHDLRSPFNGFLGLTQIMAEKLPDLTMDEIQKIAVNMRTSATSLFRLLENLLHWARIEQGLIPFNAKLINLHTIATESFAMSKEPALKKGIELNISVSEDIEVFADTNMLQTVIRNLVSNAVKYTSEGGQVVLWAKTVADKSVEICVKDSGIGMDDDILANLFHINQQTNRKGTDGEPSTGLGLIICKEFVEKHGGKLRVESKTGSGSTFSFTIPGTEGLLENTARKETEQTEKTTKPAKGLKILIAEDDETSEMLISIALKSFSKVILKVNNGYDAIETCRNNPDVDLIMMDIKMPGMDGYEATRQIRKFNKKVIIVAQTAFGNTGDREKAISEGFNDYLSKPLSISILKELIIKNFTVGEK